MYKAKMNMMKFKIILLIYSISLAKGEYSRNSMKMKLELVQVLIRHGERTPLQIEYDIVNYTDLSHYQPYGLGHLTNNGKNQAYEVGAMLRERYNDFLGSKYEPRHVYSYTSDNDRTIASLQLILAGLYIPSGDSMWNPKLKWLPMPQHIIPKPLDILFQANSNSNYVEFVRQVENSTEFLEKISNYTNLIKLLQEKLRINVKDRYKNVFLAHNILEINERLNLPLPDWYTAEVNATYTKVMKILLDRLSYTTNLKKVNGGPLVRHILENINADNTVANRRKMYLYSGHDTNIGAVTRTLGLTMDKFPDFCDALMFEKHRDTDGKVYVKILYWDRLHKTMIPLKLENCEEFCYIGNYAEAISKFIPSDDDMRMYFSDFDLKKIDRFFNKRFKY